MTAPTFTCDRCGSEKPGHATTFQPPQFWASALSRMLCEPCQDAVRQEIDNYQSATSTDDVGSKLAGEGAGGGSAVVETLHSGSPASEMRTDAVPSPVPAAPSLVERARHRALVGEHSSIGSLAPADIELLRSLADRIEELEATVRREEADHLRTITERDDTEEWADKLAYSIAPQSVIGEHSSANNPWMNALEHQHGSGVKQEWSGRPVDLASDDRSVDFTVKGDSVKMLRETFCVAQGHILRSTSEPEEQRQRHADRLQRLCDICDEHRPLGPDGKHGSRRCTPTCGCEDKPHGVADPDPRLIPLPGGRVAVAAQDLRVGDVVAFEEVTRIVRHGQLVEVQTDGDTSVFWDGTLVLLDKAAES